MEVYSVNYSQIKKRINSKNNKFSFKFFIIFLIIIVFIGIFTAIKPLKTKNIKFFYVEINSFLNYKEANKLANSVQEQGGAGYIYYDGKYHVLTSLYLKKEDANKVKENLTKDFPTCKILTLEGNLFQRNYNKFQNEIIMNTINLNQNLIKNLYNLSVEIDINQSLNYTTKFDRIKDEYISKTKDLN